MKNLYRIQVRDNNGKDLSWIYANEVYTTMERAAKYGEREHRIHGWTYRIRKVYVNLIEEF